MSDKVSGAGVFVSASGDVADSAVSAAPARSGRLVRKLGVLFLGFVVVAIAVSCALVYFTTRATYLESQSERLNQISEYVSSSIVLTGIADESSVNANPWVENAGSIDVEGDSSEWYARSVELGEQLQVLQQEASEAATTSGQDSEEYARAQQRIADLEQQMYLCDSIYYWHSVSDMLDRVKEMFSLADISLYLADAGTHEVTYITEGVDAGQGRADMPHQLGQVEQREASEYAALWDAVESGQASAQVSTSPDGSLYLSYQPIDLADGTRWICEVGISTSAFDSMVWGQMTRTLLIMGSLFTVLLVCLLALLRKTIAGPLFRLVGFVRDYSSEKSPAVAQRMRQRRWPNDEIGMLADSTADMIDEVHTHIGRIAALSTERERVRSELEIAGRIQISALPEVRPPFTGQNEFGLSASMRPAKAVGGDFYDFFLIDGRHVGVVIADVSDKGVPAALFMMRAKATIKQLLSEGLEPAQAMARANDELCHDNKEGMFVTVWMGVLDLESGQLSYSNGGHNPPLYHHAGGAAEWVRDRSGLILGCFDGAAYRGFQRTMQPGDTLLLYTDGVTDAMDEANQRFGEDRLETLMGEVSADLAPEQLTALIETRVAEFAQGADQADDITLLALRFDGPQSGVRAAGVEADS